MRTLLQSAMELYAQCTLRIEHGEDVSIIRREVFGKQGLFNKLQRQISTLTSEERPIQATGLQHYRRSLEELLAEPKSQRVVQPLDPTLPGVTPKTGTLHPITQMADRMVRIFASLGFEVADGKEIVSSDANFSWLNIEEGHPSRDSRDTFYLTDTMLLRTQTTAVQVSEIARRNTEGRMPIRIVYPGKTYRRESDGTHSPMFHQFEGLLVDTQATMSDLYGSLEYFVNQLFGEDVETRFRPHHFPFTEPSAEIDIRWKHGDGEWLEMGGCGMIHPEVLVRAGLEATEYRGWAFGMGIERCVMVDSGVPDLRLLFENNIRFLEQFPL